MRCKTCGTTHLTKDVDICLKCRSNKLTDICKINKFGYEERLIPVPYCYQQNKEVITGKKWLCHTCENYKGGRNG